MSPKSLDDFLEGASLVVDAIDYFATDAHLALHARARARGIPVLLGAPMGMSGAILTFVPSAMSFEQYFRFDLARSDTERAMLFLIGLSPALLQSAYLVDPSYVDFEKRKGPSTSMAKRRPMLTLRVGSSFRSPKST